MLVILSQKIDTKSSYEDRLYQVYHYPARYRNQLHEGDIFVYYQGNRQAKDLRYYFGTGIVGKIKSTDGINYYAELLHCHQFAKMCRFIFLVAVMLSSLDINPSEKVPIPHGKTLFALSRRRPTTTF